MSADGEANGLAVTKVVTKEVQPDVTAQIFWLKNRKPDKWRDRPEQERDPNEGVPQIVAVRPK